MASIQPNSLLRFSFAAAVFAGFSIWVHRANGDDAEPAIDRIKELSTEQHPQLVAALKAKVALYEKVLQRMKEGKIKPDLEVEMKSPAGLHDPVLYKSAEIKKADVGKAEETVKTGKKILVEAQAKKRLLCPRMQWPLTTGQIGKLTDGVKVVQVIDKQTMLCEILNHRNQTFWLEGISTAGRADDSYFNLDEDDVLEVVGTKSYDTALGAQRTVTQLRKIEPADVLKIMDQVNAKK